MLENARSSLLLVIVAACANDARPPSTTPILAPIAATDASAPANEPPRPTASTPPAAPASVCHAPPAGSTSDDLTPSLRGATGDVELVPWLEARGVGRDAAHLWLASHYGHGLSKEHAEAAFGYSHCGNVRVGDHGEEALLCRHDVPTQIMQGHAIVLIVRSKRPVALLDVGLRMVAMDFPDARWLDLALAIAPDGMSAVLDDRAPDGTTLVEPESHCREAEKHDAECEAKLAAHPNPESLAQKTGGGEMFAPLDDCMVHRGKDGRIAVHRRAGAPSPMSIYPAMLHDCKGGRPPLVEMQREVAKLGANERSDARDALAFFDKSCAQRGRWIWQKDRFVKAP